MSKFTIGAAALSHKQSPSLLPISKTDPASSPHIYSVSLVKREYGGFGFLIRQRNEIPFFSIWEIIKDGSAEANGQIRKGDIILQVNKQDLSEIGYEKGLEILKAIKPGSFVELTLQSVGNAQHEPVEVVDFTGHNSYHLPHKSVMSPLQRLKKRLISCTSTNASHNVIANTMSRKVAMNGFVGTVSEPKKKSNE